MVKYSGSLEVDSSTVDKNNPGNVHVPVNWNWHFARLRAAVKYAPSHQDKVARMHCGNEDYPDQAKYRGKLEQVQPARIPFRSRLLCAWSFHPEGQSW